MTEISVQASFNSGEWSPNLYARVDIAKYRAGAALLENFFVDYRGGASSRPGTKYVIQAYRSATQVRLLPFQASTYVGYIIEVGNGYMRFLYEGAPITETPVAITGATKANPCVLTIPGNTLVPGDWIYVTGVLGMTQLNGRYFSVSLVVGNAVTIADLNGVAINSLAYGTYTSGGTSAKIYTIVSPYTSSDDLHLIKFAQSVNQMILCHPNHPVYTLTLVAANNWSLAQTSFGATVLAPGAPAVTTTLGAGTWNFSYRVTSVDANGQESAPSTVANLASVLSLRSTAGSNKISWTAAATAVRYNVYEAEPSAFGVVPSGVSYGFIGTTQGVDFIDSNIAPDFTVTPPIPQSPFVGAGVDHVTITGAGAYTTVPTVSFTGACSLPAAGQVQLSATAVAIAFGGTGYAVGDGIVFPNGVGVVVTTIGAFGVITGWTVVTAGTISSGSTPANPVASLYSNGAGLGATANITWGVGAVVITTAGSGYLSAPTIAFSSGAATATAVLGTAGGNPTVPGFVQQRLVLAGTSTYPATFAMSRPGNYFNFDTSSPVTASDAVSGTLVSGALNSIKFIVGTFAGMIIGTDKAMWVVNGGSAGSAITPLSIVANPQSWVGANDVPPIVANYDILFVQAKGSAVRDLAYNFYYGTFTGTDISIMASHLFYGYTIEEWTWAEQPFYLANAVRNDGVMLCLTFLKEQEFVGWTHYTTDGLFKSVASVTELTSATASVDAVYTVVQRTINGSTVQYIERFAERVYSTADDAWCVDAALQYSGSPATSFTGAEHLAGETVTGLADGDIITPFVMPTSGMFTLGTAASKVTVGLPFTCKLQTLALDIGEPSIQGKTKKIVAVDVRVKDTLNISIGASFSTLVTMRDFRIGSVSSTLTGQPSQIITDLVTGDGYTILDPTYTVPGQYCIQQSDPYPATILGLFPEFTVEGRS